MNPVPDSLAAEELFVSVDPTTLTYGDEPYAQRQTSASFIQFERRGNPAAVAAGLASALDRAGNGSRWEVHRRGELELGVAVDGEPCRVLLQAGAASSTSIYPVVAPPLASTEVAVISGPNGSVAAREAVVRVVRDYCEVFSEEEADAIVRSMPLVEAFSSRRPYPAFEDFALIYRDHFLEENLALLLGFERAGVDPRWIFALAKGDRTPQRDRMRGYLRQRGYRADTFDNAWFDDRDIRREEQTANLEAFIADARRAGKRVVMIDDGGLLANCWPERQHLLDCAVEVTIVGIRRIMDLPQLTIPIYDVAQSAVKMLITYPEIAESCVRRVCDLLGSEKMRGRSTLVVGYGTAGHDVAKRLRDRGCVVTVMDLDVMKLIQAAENGFRTFRSLHAALRATRPFLVVGCTGDVAFDREAFEILPEGAFITGIATRDLECLRTGISERVELPRVGTLHRLDTGSFIQLGDGRSVNLFESEAIPNSANDVFKAGIFLAAAHMCENYNSITPGLHLDPVNDVIREAGLLDAYYDLYLRDSSDIDRNPRR
jgi:adenosylhomocysteinase